VTASSRPPSAVRRRPWAPAAACLVLLPLAAGCGGGGAPVAAPRPSGTAAADCRALHRVLPGSLKGLARRDTAPDSEFTAAWGDPAITLRCGVARPAVLDSATQAAQFGGVGWVPESTGGSGVRLTTTGRQAYVELDLPAHYTGKADSAGYPAALGAAIRKTVPAALS
jgi:hypothetical protein